MDRASSTTRRLFALVVVAASAVAIAPSRIVHAAPTAALHIEHLPELVRASSTRPGCKPVTFAKSVTRILEAADAALPSIDFACSVHIGVKNSGVAVAISVLGKKLNPKVARYVIVANRVGGGSLTRTVAVQPPAQVLRRQIRPMADGSWTVAITALASNGTSMGTWTSDAFTIN